MITLDDYQSLKRKVDRIRKERDQAEGALKQILTQIKSEFKVSTIQEAKELLDQLLKKERISAKKYTAAKLAFEKKWKKVLEKFDE